MSASTQCVVDGVIPLRRAPLGHIPKYEKAVRTWSTSPTGGVPKMRSWSLLKENSLGGNKEAFPGKFVLVKAGGLTRSKGLHGAYNTDRHQRSDVGITSILAWSFASVVDPKEPTLRRRH